ncbi:hypothetical protein [Nocardia sp. NBC_01388]|uniref:hypothetical protein n=1 Tax=Nocardia sp. NBC_01388 TaxID=2903596 RepID=UPI0032512DDE
MKFGKLPARPDAVQLKLSTYLDSIVLPDIPAEFGHEQVVPDYGMLGNDTVGDCVLAGAAHETMVWAGEAGHTVQFDTAAVESDYSAITGYDPKRPETDVGTDVQAAASYRRRIGVVDSAGQRHRVGAYVALTPGDPAQLAAAAYIFGAAGMGFQFPAYAMQEFSNRKPWDVQPGTPEIAGGHYVPVVARRGGLFSVITWGRIQEMTPEFYTRYCDEALVYLSTELLTAGRSPEGFDLAALQADLKALTS